MTGRQETGVVRPAVPAKVRKRRGGPIRLLEAVDVPRAAAGADPATVPRPRRRAAGLAGTGTVDRLATIRAATDRFLAEIADHADPLPVDAVAARPDLALAPAPNTHVVSVVPGSVDVRAGRLAVTANKHNVSVGATRGSLVELRRDQRQALEAVAWEARIARVCLLALMPAALAVRTLGGQGWAVSGGSATLLVIAAALCAVGSIWTWRVTSAPFSLARRPAAGPLTHLMRLRQAAEELAVRLATGADPVESARRVEIRNHLPSGALSSIMSVRQATAFVRGCDEDLFRRAYGREGHLARVTLLPFLACLLPAIVLTLVV